MNYQNKRITKVSLRLRKQVYNLSFEYYKSSDQRLWKDRPVNSHS